MKRVGAGLIAIAVKLGPKVLAALMKLIKLLKGGKAIFAAASMAAYAHLYSWEFAAIMMASLFVHECGHLWAMRKCGMKTKGVYFIPILGAAAVADDEFPSRGVEAYTAIMGPIWGFVLALLTGIGYLVTDDPVFAAAASWMAAVNLFNMLPVNPLDGGRIMKSVAYSIHSRAGFAFLAVGLMAAGTMAIFGGYWLFPFLTLHGGRIIKTVAYAVQSPEGFVFLVVGLMAAGTMATFGSYWLFTFLLIVGALELEFEYKRQTVHPAMGMTAIAGTAAAYVLMAFALFGLAGFMYHVPGASAALVLLMEN